MIEALLRLFALRPLFTVAILGIPLLVIIAVGRFTIVALKLLFVVVLPIAIIVWIVRRLFWRDRFDCPPEEWPSGRSKTLAQARLVWGALTGRGPSVRYLTQVVFWIFPFACTTSTYSESCDSRNVETVSPTPGISDVKISVPASTPLTVDVSSAT